MSDEFSPENNTFLKNIMGAIVWIFIAIINGLEYIADTYINFFRRED